MVIGYEKRELMALLFRLFIRISYMARSRFEQLLFLLFLIISLIKMVSSSSLRLYAFSLGKYRISQSLYPDSLSISSNFTIKSIIAILLFSTNDKTIVQKLTIACRYPTKIPTFIHNKKTFHI